MITQPLSELFTRDLNKLIEEVSLYKEEANLWVTSKEISNCAGNLCLHLAGNLNHFIGANLGNTGYVRQREKEFSLKNVAREELIQQVKEVIVVVQNTLAKLTQEDLEKKYTHRVFDNPMSTQKFLFHLALHLSYHLGQINYHRRLLD